MKSGKELFELYTENDLKLLKLKLKNFKKNVLNRLGNSFFILILLIVHRMKAGKELLELKHLKTTLKA